MHISVTRARPVDLQDAVVKNVDGRIAIDVRSRGAAAVSQPEEVVVRQVDGVVAIEVATAQVEVRASQPVRHSVVDEVEGGIRRRAPARILLHAQAPGRLGTDFSAADRNRRQPIGRQVALGELDVIAQLEEEAILTHDLRGSLASIREEQGQFAAGDDSTSPRSPDNGIPDGGATVDEGIEVGGHPVHEGRERRAVA